MDTTRKSLLVVRSVTSAMRGQKLLEQNGISAYLQRNSHPNRKEGCGYALKVGGDPFKAVQLLEQAGIPVSEIREA